MNYDEPIHYSSKESVSLSASNFCDPNFNTTYFNQQYEIVGQFDSSTSSHESQHETNTSTSSPLLSPNHFHQIEFDKKRGNSGDIPSINGPMERPQFDNNGFQAVGTENKMKILKSKYVKSTQKSKRPGRKARESMGHLKKPDETYISMIEKAIKAQKDNRATLDQIYAFLKRYHPFFTHEEIYDGWKNSIRHNLSLNQCFKKLEKTAGNSRSGKGHFWAMNPNCPPQTNAQQTANKCRNSPIISNGSVKKKRRCSQNQVKPVPQNFANLTNDDKFMILLDGQYPAYNDSLANFCDSTNQFYYQNWLQQQNLYPIMQSNETNSNRLLMPVNANQLSYFCSKVGPTNLNPQLSADCTDHFSFVGFQPPNFSTSNLSIPEPNLLVSAQNLPIPNDESQVGGNIQLEMSDQRQIKLESANGIPGIDSIYSSTDPNLNLPITTPIQHDNSSIAFQSPQYPLSTNFYTQAAPYISTNFHSSDMSTSLYSTAPSIFDNVGQQEFFASNLNEENGMNDECLQYEIVSADCNF